jgi:hypothetical protein
MKGGLEASSPAGKGWRLIKNGSRGNMLDWRTEIGSWPVRARVGATNLGQTNIAIRTPYRVKTSELMKTDDLDECKQRAKADLLAIRATLPDVETWRRRSETPEYQNKFQVFIERRREHKRAAALCNGINQFRGEVLWEAI